jgi:hypothetical protein
LNTHFVDGQGYVLGEQTGDHWFLYHVDHSAGKPLQLRRDRTMELMMEDLDGDTMKLFHIASHGQLPSSDEPSPDSDTQSDADPLDDVSFASSPLQSSLFFYY